MMAAAEYARERRHPLLRHLLRLPVGGRRVRAQRLRPRRRRLDRVSTRDTPHKVIYKLRDLLGVDDLGGTMRLGTLRLRARRRARSRGGIYGDDDDPRAPPPPLRVQLPLRDDARPSTACASRAARPTASSSRSPSCPDHPWFVAVQFHPEFKSKPLAPASAVRGLRRARASSTGSGARRASRRPGGSRGRALVTREPAARRPTGSGARSRASGPLFLIAGPCVIESGRIPHRVAARLRRSRGALGMPFVFKASYDKANRSSLGSFRGPGLERGPRDPGRACASATACRS